MTLNLYLLILDRNFTVGTYETLRILRTTIKYLLKYGRQSYLTTHFFDYVTQCINKWQQINEQKAVFFPTKWKATPESLRTTEAEFLLLYNCGMFFFILSFFAGYILSFGLVRFRTIRLNARADARIECRCSRSRAEDGTISDVIIKNPDRKWDWDANDVMPGSEGLGILVIFENRS